MDRCLRSLHHVPHNYAKQTNADNKYEWYASTVFVACTPQEFLHKLNSSYKQFSWFKVSCDYNQKSSRQRNEKNKHFVEAKNLPLPRNCPKRTKLYSHSPADLDVKVINAQVGISQEPPKIKKIKKVTCTLNTNIKGETKT